MRAAARRQAKKYGVLLGTAGLLFALFVILGFKLLGISAVSYEELVAAAITTALLQAGLLLILQLRWDERLTWDPHFLYVPLFAAIFLLNLYTYFVPELQEIGLAAWMIALLFAAGLLGFWEVVLLNTSMAVGYLIVVDLLLLRGEPVPLAYKGAVAVIFVALGIYAAIVSERLRRDHSELKTMRKQMAELAVTDFLTELPNRRYLEDLLAAELARIRRHGGACSLAMVDVDDFKEYNDTFGHVAGDAVLRELATVLRRELRISDVLARYGGEEFALVMPNANADDAHRGVERLRAIVEGYTFTHERELSSHGLTVSAGIASCVDEAVEPEVLVEQADAALYCAKRNGKNRVRAAALPAPAA